MLLLQLLEDTEYLYNCVVIFKAIKNLQFDWDFMGTCVFWFGFFTVRLETCQ